MKISQLLSKESKWTKGALARDKDGKIISCIDTLYVDQGRKTFDLAKKAASWSLYGAIFRCYDWDDHEQVTEKLHSAMKKILGEDMYIARFNDHEKTNYSKIKQVVEEAGV
jgi:hypothetical protein